MKLNLRSIIFILLLPKLSERKWGAVGVMVNDVKCTVFRAT